jgi:hypothetical protein
MSHNSIIGYRRNGTPIRVIRGGSEQPGELSAEDRAVADQLGISTGDDGQGEGDGGEQDLQDQGQEPSKLEDLPESWQAEIRKLRREAAAKRVANKAPAPPAKAVEGETPEQVEQRVRASLSLEFGARVASADVKAALTGIVPDALLESVVGRLNIADFVTDDGQVDTDAVTALKEEYVALLGTSKKATPKVGHGRTTGTTKTRSNAELFSEALFGTQS